MKRRSFIAVSAGATAATLAGCVQSTSDNGDDSSVDDTGTDDEADAEPDTLHVATYSSFIDAPSDSPGEWVKDEFEARNDVTLEWHTPAQEINHSIERHNQGAEIEPELFLGVTPLDLVRVDENTDDDLFIETDRDELEHAEDIGEQHEFDPYGRVIPVHRSLCAVVYDGRNVDTPETFEDLTDSKYDGQIGISNPQRGTTGLLFLLWTINEFGEDGYLDYWDELFENNIRVTDSWSEVYTQFEEEELPVVVSYSNDRVYAKRFGNDLDKHQVSLLNDEAYANVTGMARFAEHDESKDELIHTFMDFMLDPEVQSVVAERNVTGPTNEQTEVPDVYADYAKEPEDAVFFDYDDLSGNLSDWVDEWGRAAAGQ